MERETGTMRRRGLLGTLLGTLAGLGLLNVPGATHAEAVDNLLQQETDRYLAALNQQITEAFAAVGGEAALIGLLTDKPSTWKGDVTNIYNQLDRLSMNGRWALFSEYRRWLGPIPAYHEDTGQPAGISGYSPDVGAYVPAIDLASWAPDRLKNPDLQRSFVQWRLFGLQ